MATTAETHIVEYTETHDRKESLLYNNRCFLMYINPTDERKIQYEVNREYILNKFKQ